MNQQAPHYLVVFMLHLVPEKLGDFESIGKAAQREENDGKFFSLSFSKKDLQIFSHDSLVDIF
jgi:hypothetical protein